MKATDLVRATALTATALALRHQQPLVGDLSQDLDQIIDSSALLCFHRALVQIPSISEHEKDVGEYVLDFLTSQNLTVEKQIVTPASESEEERFNIYAYVGQNRHPDVLVTSHIDTVPPFIPYSLHAPNSDTGSFNRTDLVIAGRGTVDAKASVAAIVFAALETLAENPHASVGLLFDVGEENSGVGMKHFSNSELNPTPPTYHTVIFGEPTELSLVAAHKGTLGFKLVAEGKAAHSGYPWLGQSAISSLVPVLTHLDTLQDLPPNQGGLLRSETLGKSTLNIGLVHGGIAANVVPADAEAAITIRLAAGAPEDTRVIVERAVASVAQGDESVYLDFGDRKSGAPPQYFDVDVDGFEVITVNYGTDAPALRIHDHEARRVRRYLYGPGSILVAHADDEAITVGELEEAVRGYKRLIAASLSKSYII